MFFFFLRNWDYGGWSVNLCQLRYMESNGADVPSGIQPHIQPYHNRNVVKKNHN